MAKRQEHTHKFKIHKYKTGTAIYFCTLPDCNKKVAPALALGKRTICWRCGEDFIMNDYSIRLAKPHCDKCHSPRGSVKHIEPDVTTNPSFPIVYDLVEIEAPYEQALKNLERQEEIQEAVNITSSLRDRLHGAVEVAKAEDEGDI